MFGLQVGLCHIAHEIVISRNPPLRIFTGDRLERSSIDQPLHLSCFYENVRESKYCEHHILTEGVFVTQLCSNAGIW
jgi:hypothetical protein